MKAHFLCFALALTACGSLNIKNGQLQCSVTDQKCPDDYHCATDGTCWQNGQDPMGSGACVFDHSTLDNCALAP